MSWEPEQYLKYASERLRPALDLMARIDLAAPRSVVDLGCGAGNVTRILAQRWPRAHFIGVDNSAEMLAKARGTGPDGANIEWCLADLAEWVARPRPQASILSSATPPYTGWMTTRRCSRGSSASSRAAACLPYKCRRICMRRRTSL
jgi:trans-aconitate 2-methyltransferase